METSKTSGFAAAIHRVSLCLLLTACAALDYKGATIHLPPADSKVSKHEIDSVVAIVGKAAYERGWAAMEPSPFDRRDETGFISQYGSRMNVSVWVPEDRSEVRIGIADWTRSPEKLHELRDEIRHALETQFPDRHLVVTDDDIGLWRP